MTMSVDDFSCVCGYLVELIMMTSQNKGEREGRGAVSNIYNHFSRPERQGSFL
jgi:hypothetical protein